MHLLNTAYSTGGSSGGDREILVQHLLVKEDDLNLLVELQKRVAGGMLFRSSYLRDWYVC